MSRLHENVTWACAMCTFINEGTSEACEMCQTPRPDSAKDPKRTRGAETVAAPLSQEDEDVERAVSDARTDWDTRSYVYWDKSARAYSAASQHFDASPRARAFAVGYMAHTLGIMLTQKTLENTPKYVDYFRTVEACRVRSDRSRDE